MAVSVSPVSSVTLAIDSVSVLLQEIVFQVI